MVRTRKLAGAALAAALVVGGLTAGSAVASPTGSTCGGSGTMTKTNGTLADHATYVIQCPAGAWNGTLFLYSHGYVAPTTTALTAVDASDPVTGAWLLSQGYAIAGSSYASNGWAVQQALPDQISTLDAFDTQFGTPSRTIAWGDSLGGMITAGLIQDYPNRFSAALPMCGVLSGGVATWNTALDAEFAFKQLLAPTSALQLVNITSPGPNLTLADSILNAAQTTPQGQARLALVSALSDTPGWFTTGSAEPAPTAFAAQEANQFQWAENVTFPFVFAFRAELELRAGGNPSWNTGVNYFADLAKSADLREVVALYKAAGLSLTKDLLTLNSAARISAKPSAVSYLAQNIAYNGEISVPVLTLHTTGDGLVVPENEQAYRTVVDRDGHGNLLRQLFVARAGHCAFTPAEKITAIGVLLNRLATGHWNVPNSATLNNEAAAVAVSVPDSSPLPPAFTSYTPAQYLRPFDLPPALPFFSEPQGARSVP
jgi:pimeloyl-ACP methyl ester carboxylesterase